MGNIGQYLMSAGAAFVVLSWQVGLLDQSEVATLKTLTGSASVDYTNRLRKDDAFAQARGRRALAT